MRSITRYLVGLMTMSFIFLVLAPPSLAQGPALGGELTDWSGNWRSTDGELRLLQSGDRVYGDYADLGYIEGRLSADGREFRGTFQWKDDPSKRGYLQLRKGEEWVFTGQKSLQSNGLPKSGSEAFSGIRTQLNPSPLKWAKGKKHYWMEPWQKATPRPQERAWLAFTDAGSRAIQRPETSGSASADGHFGRRFTLMNDGIDYGPFRKGKDFDLHISEPTADRYVVGVSPGGRDGILLHARMAENSKTRLVGIWMEIKDRQLTGRWGTAKLQYRTNSGELHGFWAAGLRNPVKPFSGHPGGILSSTRVSAEYSSYDWEPRDSRSRLVELTTRQPEFGFIEGLYPRRRDFDSIANWLRTHKPGALCGQSCMGLEPEWVNVDKLWLTLLSNENRPELYGTVSTRLVEVDRQDRVTRVASSPSVVYKANRDAPTRIENYMTVGPGFVTVPPPFDHGGSYCTGNSPANEAYRARRQGVALSLPPGVWTDPLRDIAIETSINLAEKDVRKAGDEAFTTKKVSRVKAALGDTLEAYYMSGTYRSRQKALEALRNQSDGQFCFRDKKTATQSTGRYWVQTTAEVQVGRR